MKGAMGLKMSNEEVDEYMSGLITAKESTLEGLEAECLDRWKALTADISKASEELTRARGLIERLQAGVQDMHGQRKAHVQLLIAAEEGRRNAKNPNLEVVKDLPKGETKVASEK